MKEYNLGNYKSFFSCSKQLMTHVHTEPWENHVGRFDTAFLCHKELMLKGSVPALKLSVPALKLTIDIIDNHNHHEVCSEDRLEIINQKIYCASYRVWIEGWV